MQCNSTNVKYLNSSLRCLTAECLSSSSNNKFDWRTSVETANVAIAIFDDGDRLCYVNIEMQTITGYTRAELLSQTDLLLQLQLIQQANWTVNNSAIKNREISLTTKNGDRCWLNCSIYTAEFNQQSATLVIAVDITPYKQA